MEPIVLDGATGEGGGQILRSALGLSALTGRPFRIARIRAGREKPGLLRQHLAGVRAVADLCGAEVEGATLGSTSLAFRPSRLRGGVLHAAVGSAGSAGLVLQALLPALLGGEGPVSAVLEGGTHNDASPPAPFLERALVPRLAALGAFASVTCEAVGFYPAGGGRYRVEVTPRPLAWVPLDDGPAVVEAAEIVSAQVPGSVIRREAERLAARLDAPVRPRTVASPGPGNVVVVHARRGAVTEVFTGFGRRGVPAETVVDEVLAELDAWRAGPGPVGPHLADQLLIPLALAGGGAFLTGPPTLHTTTNAGVVARFLPVDFAFEPVPGGVRVRCAPR